MYWPVSWKKRDIWTSWEKPHLIVTYTIENHHGDVGEFVEVLVQLRHVVRHRRRRLLRQKLLEHLADRCNKPRIVSFSRETTDRRVHRWHSQSRRKCVNRGVESAGPAGSSALTSTLWLQHQTKNSNIFRLFFRKLFHFWWVQKISRTRSETKHVSARPKNSNQSKQSDRSISSWIFFSVSKFEVISLPTISNFKSQIIRKYLKRTNFSERFWNNKRKINKFPNSKF